MAYHCFKLWLLYPGCTLGRCSTNDRYADDSKNMRLCMDRLNWISVYEKKSGIMIKHTSFGKIIAFPKDVFFLPCFFQSENKFSSNSFGTDYINILVMGMDDFFNNRKASPDSFLIPCWKYLFYRNVPIF